MSHMAHMDEVSSISLETTIQIPQLAGLVVLDSWLACKKRVFLHSTKLFFFNGALDDRASDGTHTSGLSAAAAAATSLAPMTRC